MFFLDTDISTEKRWDASKFIPYLNGCYDIVQSYVCMEIKKLPLGGKFMIQGEENDPALLSFEIYGDTQYWWLILLYNGYTSLDDLQTGEIVKFPDLSDLDDLYFLLKDSENKYGGEYYE